MFIIFFFFYIINRIIFLILFIYHIHDITHMYIYYWTFFQLQEKTFVQKKLFQFPTRNMASVIEHPVYKSRPNIAVRKWWPVGLRGGMGKGRKRISGERETLDVVTGAPTSSPSSQLVSAPYLYLFLSFSSNPYCSFSFYIL